MTVTDDRLLYNIPDAAERLSISRAMLYKEINRGSIKVVRIGGAVRISADELRRYAAGLVG